MLLLIYTKLWVAHPFNTKTMRTNIILTVVAGSVLSVAAVSCHSKKHASEAAGTEKIDVAVPEVQSIVIYNTYPGTLTANLSVDVKAKVNGTIQSKNYVSGAPVKKGQSLFTIDPTLYRDALNQAEATLATAKSTRDYAKEHFEAVKKALESDAVSKMEVVQAESAYKQAEASIKQAEAAVSTARTRLGYCNVTAPIDGDITDNAVSAGNYVSGEASPFTLCTIYDNSMMNVHFAIADDEFLDLLNSMNRNDSLNLAELPVEFSEELPHKYTASLDYMAPAMKTTTGTLNLKAKIDNTYKELRAGMYAKIKLPSSRLDNAVLVKDASIGTDQLGKYLYVVNDSNKVVYTPVETGELYCDTLRVITKGINPDDRYVTKALLKVRDGMTIDPVIVK